MEIRFTYTALNKIESRNIPKQVVEEAIEKRLLRGPIQKKESIEFWRKGNNLWAIVEPDVQRPSDQLVVITVTGSEKTSRSV